jgi:hypothetical protein
LSWAPASFSFFQVEEYRLRPELLSFAEEATF